MDKRKRSQRKGKNSGLLLLSLPTLIWYLVFCYLPMFGIVIAFKRYKPVPGKGFIYSLFQKSPCVGFDNFKFLFLNPQMLLTVRNTLAYNLTFLVIDTVLPVALAILLSYLYSKKLSMAVQTAAMLPHFLSWVVVSYFLYTFLSTDRGLFNNILINTGNDPVRWYQNPGVWPVILIITHTWKAYGYALVMYMAYITAIDQELYDSAIVDGADVFQMINHITLPMLRPIILVLLILNLGNILNTDFGLFYQATRNSGSILSSTQTIDVYIYKALMENANYGYSAAASLIQNTVGCFLLIVANYAAKKINPEEGIL
ncbi:ABC transporter permease subunit [Butyrivibrio sp. AC2005]|uniref:ABC transporter permease subunit n=1 Tax=Butyrivibrio sp. AC2005 TaxID=1280672 RepID=UPI0004225077|nr:ABC transporter permease subunit [Butyrivibrio sp. AC2005]